MKNYEYLFKRKKKKTVSIHITKCGEVEIIGPLSMTKKQADQVFKDQGKWIEKAIQSFKAKAEQVQAETLPINTIIEADFKKRAIEYFPERTQYLADINNPIVKKAIRMGELKYDNIKVTYAKTSWGSCVCKNGKNHINLSWRLMALCDYDKSLCDYVIVHELCHTVFHNHSKEFWNLVETLIPDYKEKKQKIHDFEKTNKSLFVK